MTDSSKRSRVPKYRPHKSGQARVTINGKDHYLGRYGTPQSRRAYDQVVREWLANDRQLPCPAVTPIPQKGATVAEVILAYWRFAEEYYGWLADPHRGDRYAIRDALRTVRELHADLPAASFGPRALKAVRDTMIAKGWSRRYINAQIIRIRRMFAWAASEEIIAGSVCHNLATVDGLQKGKTAAPETPKIRPVDEATVEATLPHLLPTVRAMVLFQRHTGCRPSEVCLLRPKDLDMSSPACWSYTPSRHKTECHGHDRTILIGPKAQAVLRPYLGAKLDGYLFSPIIAKEEWAQQRKAAAKAPIDEDTVERRRKASPLRPPKDCYTRRSYARAILRACEKAFPPPAPLCKKEDETIAHWRKRLSPEEYQRVREWNRRHSWHPNQLRHLRATELRRHGLDKTKTILGHAKIETSQLYAERDMLAAMELVSRIG